MFDFDTPVDRSFYHTDRDRNKPVAVKAANLPSYAASEADFRFAPVIEQTLLSIAREGIYQYHSADKVFTDHISWWIENSRKSSISPNWIVPSFGTIYSINLLLSHFLGTNEKVAVLTPCFGKYALCASQNRRETISVPLQIKKGRYEINFNQLEKVLANPTVRLLILCNPHNPIGQIWSKEDVQRIVILAKQYNVAIFSDEIFADNTYQNRQVTPIWTLYPENSISLTSLHKAFCLTGACQANLIIPNPKLRQEIIRLRDAQYFGCIETFSYCAILHAYTPEGLQWVRDMNVYTEKNISYISSYISQHIPSIHVFGGEGAFILWLDFRELFGSDEEALIKFCHEEALFDVVFGSQFGPGGKGFVRMCVASPLEYIKKGLRSLEKAVRSQFPSYYKK